MQQQINFLNYFDQSFNVVSDKDSLRNTAFW